MAGQYRLFIFSRENIEKRLNTRKVVDPVTGCWRLNKGVRPNGYGALKSEKELYYTHRLSAWLYLGLDLDDPKQQANHKVICPYHDCWNPSHLYVGGQKQNAEDRRFLEGRRNISVLT